MGPLESRVMEALWGLGSGTVRQVWERLGGEAEIAYTTVLTTLQRLHDKGLVRREVAGRAHRYRPRTSRLEFEGGVFSRVLGGILGRLRRNRPVGLLGRLSARDRALLRELLDEADPDP